MQQGMCARGNTQRALVKMLRESGALEVHVRISSPPVKWPCFYGIDFATRDELIANEMTVAQICESIGADSLGYVSVEGLTQSTGIPAGQLCRACFDGVYPVPVPGQVVAEEELVAAVSADSALANEAGVGVPQP